MNDNTKDGSNEPLFSYPRNARELPKRKPPTAESLYRRGKTNPEWLIGGNYGK